MNKLTACQRHQRLQNCKYQTESDIYRAGITLGTFSGSLTRYFRTVILLKCGFR